MTTIRALVVDDDPRNINYVKNRLNPQFVRFGWQVEWEETGDPDAGLRLITTRPAPYDLLVIDLIFPRVDMPDSDEAQGLELIGAAAERSRKTYVLAISSGSRQRPDLYENARKRGAHRSIPRGQFTNESQENSPQVVAAAIREHLENHDAVPTVTIVADQYDPNIQAFLHEVGKTTLSQLHRQILNADGRGPKEIRAEYLTQGASGAGVCALIAEVEQAGTFRFVLKVSRNGAALRDEAERGLRARAMLPPRLVVAQQREQPVGPVSGWHALGMPLEDGATTLRAWLATGPSARQIESVLSVLFMEGLGRLCKDSPSGQREAPLTTLRLPAFRQCRILAALKELAGTLTRVNGCGIEHAGQLIRDLQIFVTEGRIGKVAIRRTAQPSPLVYTHGDLHGGNVLVYTGSSPTPALIDTSEFGLAHWATDHARLVADLLMRNVDAGTESMYFDRFPAWRELARRVGDRDAVPREAAGPANRAALTSLGWIAANLQRSRPGVALGPGGEHRWEWRLALATYLLRYSYHHEVHPPKRALALVAAHDQIRAAVQALPN